MKEYRVRAIFKDFPDRTYKRKVTTSYDEALKLKSEADEYYWGTITYLGHLENVVIESREVSEWH